VDIRDAAVLDSLLPWFEPLPEEVGVKNDDEVTGSKA